MNRKRGIVIQLIRLKRQFSTAAKGGLTYYELLGVKETASAAEIKAAYYEKTKLYHPDMVMATENTLRTFRQISEAYEILGSDTSRKEYDEKVLGLAKEGTSTEVDPIAAYKRMTMRHDIGYNWTKSYCEYLRKGQSGSHVASMRSTVVKKNDYSNFLMLSFLSMVFFGFILINQESRFKSSKKAPNE